ncbi:hypothetical protein EVAR_32160_1 [Eumeta japonica]|uniref:Secreted protein n=1 Tax=Eumeta variegata TaxID=151549 RepID=A0A4C1W0B5_EUMVA|nr:hypothetical protein EVAR_32160_1 [Eumeta japonica]
MCMSIGILVVCMHTAMGAERSTSCLLFRKHRVQISSTGEFIGKLCSQINSLASCFGDRVKSRYRKQYRRASASRGPEARCRSIKIVGGRCRPEVIRTKQQSTYLNLRKVTSH